MYKNILFKEYFELILMIFVILIIRAIVIEPFRIPSSSMKPTLLVGDFILANKFVYNFKIPLINKACKITFPKNGDIVIFYKDGSRYIKRVIGVSGNFIFYRHKKIYINSIKVKTKKRACTYVNKKNKCIVREYLTSKKEYELRIKVLDYNYISDYLKQGIDYNNYFVLGDNRDNSSDGRFFGLINNLDIRGKAFFIWISLDVKKFDIRWNRIFKVVK
jgi:signal peptidase I